MIMIITKGLGSGGLITRGYGWIKAKIYTAAQSAWQYVFHV